MELKTLNYRIDASPIDDDPSATKRNLTEWGKVGTKK